MGKFVKVSSVIGTKSQITTMDDEGTILGLANVKPRKDKVLRAAKAIAFVILERSKARMVDIHYNVMKRHFGQANLRLMMTDTDSLIYEIKSKTDVLEKFLKIPEYFDLSLCTERVAEILKASKSSGESLLTSTEKEVMERIKHNKGVHGLLKAEEGNKLIHRYVGLCAKMYALRMVSANGEVEITRKGKGVPKAVLLREASFEHYEKMAEEPYMSTVSFKAMRSNNHVVRIKEMNRKMLSCVNDKVFTISTKESRPLGHFRNQSSASASSEEQQHQTASGSGLVRQ